MSEEKDMAAENPRQENENAHFPEDIHAPVQPGTTNQQTETENMEVHHHTHGGHGKKTWKGYFWEFLMLFLAVFCGFLAEYYLEHRIEKERGNQFLESFYEDLRSDTARISLIVNFDDEKIEALGSLGNCYNNIINNPANAGCLAPIIKHTAINRPFIRTERTLRQLANAGGFRLLKQEDADSILSYDKAFNDFLDFQSTIFQEAQNNVRNTFNSIGNFKANEQMFKPQAGQLISVQDFKKEDVTAFILFSTDKAAINRYFNELQLYYRVTYNHKRMLLNLKQQQSWLLDYFKKKYHFE